MAWYVAHHHVGLANYTARPGEVFEADFTPENENRLIRNKAIEKVDIDPLPPESIGELEPETAGELGLKVLEEEAEEFAALSESKDEQPAEAEEATEDVPIEIDVSEAVKPAKKGGSKKK